MNIRHLVCSNICSLENLFKVFLVFPACTFLQTSELVLTVICGILFAKRDIQCGELTSSFGKVHSASPVCLFVFFCAMTCRNPVSCWEPMCYGSVLGFMLFVVKSSKHFLRLRWSVQSVSLLLPEIVCVEVWVIFSSSFSSSEFSALWIFLSLSFIVSIFIFSTCN